MLLQSLLLIPFGIALFYLWRAAAPSQPWLKWIVAAGFLARAVFGQALFWISWLHLPLLRSLQMGDGYWVFARDATFYFPQAIEAAKQGLRAIVFYDRGAASVSYVQLLACTISLLGSVASVGILLNLFCYLGTIALLMRWTRAQPRTRPAVAVAIAAISLSPSLVLWSLQPLKDSFFQLLFVAFVTMCATWQRAWLARDTWRTRAATGTLLAVILFLLAGVRWYFAGALVAATSLFLLSVAFRSTERKMVSLGAAAIMIAVLTQSLVLSAAPYMPRTLTALPTAIEQTRRGFDATPAATMITSGSRLTVADPTLPPSPTPLADADATRIRALLDEQTTAWNRHDVARAMGLYWRSPELEVVDGTTMVRGWEEASERFGRALRNVRSVRMTGLRLAGAGDMVSTVSGRYESTNLDGHTQASAFAMTLRRFPNGEWKIVREAFLSSSKTPRVQTRLERLLAGAAALVFPSGLGERLDLFEIGGGSGLLWFTEIDTLIFDAVLIFALWAVYAAHAALAWRFPLTWLVLLTILILLPPLVYTISNFGTLFRLREIIYLGLLLIPIGALDEVRRDGCLASRAHRRTSRSGGER